MCFSFYRNSGLLLQSIEVTVWYECVGERSVCLREGLLQAHFEMILFAFLLLSVNLCSEF